MNLCLTILQPNLPVFNTTIATPADKDIVVNRMEIHACHFLLVCSNSTYLFICSKVPNLHVLVSRAGNKIVLPRGVPFYCIDAIFMCPESSQHLTALGAPQTGGGILTAAHDKRFEGMPRT